MLPGISGGGLRPLGVGEILDVSINLYFRHFLRLLGVAAAVVIPLTLVTFVLDVFAFQEAKVFDPDAALYQVGDAVRVLDESRYQILVIAQTVIGVIGYLLVIGAAFWAVSQAYLGHEPDARASIGFAARRLHSLLWLSFLLVLFIGFGFLVLIIPGIYLTVALVVTIPVFMLEGAKGTRAINRSSKLVSQNWWRVFAILLVGFIFIGLFQFLLGLVAGVSDGLAEDNIYLWAFIYDAVSGLTTVITAPLQAAIITVIYYDLRVRKEGLDVAMLSAGLEAPVPPVAVDTGPAPGDPPPPTTPPIWPEGGEHRPSQPPPSQPPPSSPTT
jgi:hypothetical protein